MKKKLVKLRPKRTSLKQLKKKEKFKIDLSDFFKNLLNVEDNETEEEQEEYDKLFFEEMRKNSNYLSSLSEEEQSLVTSTFHYLVGKSTIYLIKGPDKYRKGDLFFRMPDIDWDEDDYKAIEEGCNK